MKISNWAETVGIVTVVLSLVFVGFEIRQSNKIALTVFQSESSTDLNDFHNEVIADSHVAELLFRLQNPDPAIEFSGVDQRRIQSVSGRILNRWYSVYVARQNGIVDDLLYEYYLADVAQVVRRMPALVPYMRASIELMGVEQIDLFQPIFNPGEPLFESTEF